MLIYINYTYTHAHKHVLRSTPRPSGPRRRMVMESPPKFGLGTINISGPCGRTDLTKACVWSLSMGIGMFKKYYEFFYL